MTQIEKPRLKVGIIPLTDCAPIVLAEELGAFDRHGLDVEIRRESSWATIRDKVALGLLDAAQMLAPMPLAATLGIDSMRVPMVAPLVLDLNGNAITLSTALWREIADATPRVARNTLLDARALLPVIRQRMASGRPPITLSSVFPFSSHNYQLRLWLAAGGIDPDRDVRLTVVPPPHTIAHLSAGVIDGYCVGEPWNQQAVTLGIGRLAATGYDIWKAMPEKVLGTTEAWAERHPHTLIALAMALIEACAWLDEPANRPEAARILASPRYVNVPVEAIERSLLGRVHYTRDGQPVALPDFHVFHRYAANFPWRSHAEWFVAQMVRWGQAPRGVDAFAVADRVFRSDLYRRAAAELGLACPRVDRKPEGLHEAPWMLPTDGAPIAMAPDIFLDGSRFDPSNEAAPDRAPAASAPRTLRSTP
jgi:ABC-type nitrate/sulfonate/bicarbonate transport system substrate-binding protein